MQKRANNVVGQHFNGPRHSLNNIKVASIEKVFERRKISLRIEKVCGLKITGRVQGVKSAEEK